MSQRHLKISDKLDQWIRKDRERGTLNAMNEYTSNGRIFYIRYMEDIIILPKTRRHLRKAIDKLNQIISTLSLALYLEKKFIRLHLIPVGLW